LLVAVGHQVIVFTFWFTACVFPVAIDIEAPVVLITLQGGLLFLVFFWLTACVFPVTFGIDAPFVLITLQGILLFSFFWLFFIWLAAV